MMAFQIAGRWRRTRALWTSQLLNVFLQGLGHILILHVDGRMFGRSIEALVERNSHEAEKEWISTGHQSDDYFSLFWTTLGLLESWSPRRFQLPQSSSTTRSWQATLTIQRPKVVHRVAEHSFGVHAFPICAWKMLKSDSSSPQEIGVGSLIWLHPIALLDDSGGNKEVLLPCQPLGTGACQELKVPIKNCRALGLDLAYADSAEPWPCLAMENARTEMDHDYRWLMMANEC